MMVRGLLLLAFVMVVAGAYAMVNGAGMILNERGWSQLISGSVVLTGGFIVAALSAILAEMQKGNAHSAFTAQEHPNTIHRAPDSSPAPALAGPEAVSQHHAPSVPVRQKPDAQMAHYTPISDTPISEPHSSEGHASEGHARVHSAVVPASVHTVGPDPADPYAPSTVLETVITPPAADYEQISPVASPHAVREAVNFAPEPVTPLSENSATRPQLRQPTLFELVQDQASLMPPSAPLPPLVEPPLPPPPLSPPAERVLLASYSTGGVGYFMYSDQSIEAEMAIGRYRFSSMDELRRFIETQEGGVKVSG
jgi:hypothetical protein